MLGQMAFNLWMKKDRSLLVLHFARDFLECSYAVFPLLVLLQAICLSTRLTTHRIDFVVSPPHPSSEEQLEF